jgi:hypothetical protein
MSQRYNIEGLTVRTGISAEDAANQAHLTLISCLELAQQLTEQTADDAAGRIAFALVYLLENAEKLAGVADDELQRRAYAERRTSHAPSDT